MERSSSSDAARRMEEFRKNLKGTPLDDETLAEFRSGADIDPQQEEQRIREYVERFPEKEPAEES